VLGLSDRFIEGSTFMALRHTIAMACLIALTAAPAAAADLGGATPTTLRFDNTAPAPIWTGLYVGADAGLSFANVGTVNGFVGDAHIGYNYQMGRLVLGPALRTWGTVAM
jgi:hypothetical protein